MISKTDVESLVPRKDRYRKMIEQDQIPQSDNHRFIVPCLERSFGFKTNQFLTNSQMLQKYIDRVSFEGFIRKANRIIDHQLYEKAQKQTEPFFNIISFLLKLSIILGIFTFTILSIIVYVDIDEKVSNTILVVTIILIIFSVLIAVLCPVVLYRSEYQEHNYEALISEKLLKLKEEANKYFMENGKEFLKWEFQEDYFWVELRIDEEEFLKSEQANRLIFRARGNDNE